MTALFSAPLRHLGYRPEITVLSLPVTYASMKNRDIDVFLGNWMPSQGGDRKSYVDDRLVLGMLRQRNVRLCDEFVSAERR